VADYHHLKNHGLVIKPKQDKGKQLVEEKDDQDKEDPGEFQWAGNVINLIFGRVGASISKMKAKLTL